MDPKKIPLAQYHAQAWWGDASRVIQTQANHWSAVTWEVDGMLDHLPHLLNMEGKPEQMILAFDMMWLQTDIQMWEGAKKLDRPGESGRVAKEFGLVDPKSPTRPTFTEYLFKSLIPSTQAIEAATTPAPAPSPYVEAISAVAPSEKSTQSGHAFVTETVEDRSKSKKKTKGKPAANLALDAEVFDAEEPQGLESFPIALPTHFKLGKRHLKVIFIFE